VDAVARLPRRNVPLLYDLQAGALHLRSVVELRTERLRAPISLAIISRCASLNSLGVKLAGIIIADVNFHIRLAVVNSGLLPSFLSSVSLRHDFHQQHIIIVVFIVIIIVITSWHHSAIPLPSYSTFDALSSVGSASQNAAAAPQRLHCGVFRGAARECQHNSRNIYLLP
jgi:hypothetical protein